MTASDPQSPLPDGRDRSENERITVSMRGDTPPSGESDPPASPWLYIAGAIVTLAALYAVNFGLEDSSFALLTYLLAIGGYGTSFILRVRGISLRGLQVPMLTLLGFFFLLSLLFSHGASSGDSPSRNLQIALTWVAILHSYTLTNNAAVLFACVPGMTLIALVSTSTTEVEAQNAFLIFFCAATFLLIHENYLRTQAHTLRKSGQGRRSVLFGSQFALAVGCFLGAILLARLTVVPMQFIGERLFPQGTLSALRGAITKNLPAAFNSNERTNYEIATGPISATETQVMEVHCDEPLYWRGGTFATYTGHSFQNNAMVVRLLNQSSQQTNSDAVPGTTFDPAKVRGRFQLLPDSRDLSERDMTGSRSVHQHFKMLGMSTTQIVGAARIKDLDCPVPNIQTDNVGSLTVLTTLQANDEYDVVSTVASSSPDILRAAPADQIPPDIEQAYLQRVTQSGAENPVLAKLAADWTRGLTNNYDKALAIQHNIAESCNYNLNTPSAPRDQDIVEYFLTQSKQGYCDSFGAAMTVMCRYAGIPARMALGFLPGDETASHTYLVKDKHRHIWTEVFFPHIGWVPFDATSGATDTTARTDTSTKKNSSFLAWLRNQGVGPKAIELLLALLVAYLVKTELIDRIKPRAKQQGRRLVVRPPGNIAVLTAYSAAMKLLARRGLARDSNMTTVEFETIVHARMAASEAGSALTELTELHDRYFYGKETASPQQVKRAEEALRRLQDALRQFKGDPGKGLSTRKSGSV